MTSVNRRNFLKGSLTTAISVQPLLEAQTQGAVPPAAKTDRIIDTHVYLSRWPTKRMKGDQTPELVDMLRTHGVVQAWAGSFDALLHKDMAGLNSRLAAECEEHGHGLLVPFGAVNPKLPDWEEDLRRCHEEFRMPGIRLHPNYQHYTLTDPAFLRMLQLAGERGLIIQIVAWMEEQRCPNPFLRVRTVDLGPLPALLEKAPRAKVIVLNGFLNEIQQLLPQLKKNERLAFDFAGADPLLALKTMVEALGVERVVFGSYSPMFYFESSLLKVREAALTPMQSGAIFERNVRRLLTSV